MEQIIIYLICKYSGDWMKIYNFLDENQEVDFKELKSTLKKINFDYSTIISDNYPNSLKTIYKPPFAIFYYGQFSIINNRAITLIGNPVNNIELINKLIDANISIILEFSENTDFSFIKNEKYYGKIIFVVKNGINQIRKSNLFEIIKNNYLIISEIPFEDQNQYDIAYFYRILLGISKNILLLDEVTSEYTKSIIKFADNESYYVFANEKFKNQFYKQYQNMIFYDNFDGLISLFYPKS